MYKKEFDAYYDEYWYKLYAYAFNILKNKEAAEDCVQNIFVDFWNRSSKIKIDNVNAYLYQSVKYQCAKYISKQKKLTFYNDFSAIVSESVAYDEDVPSETELTKALHNQIDKLPFKCKQVFKYSKLDKKSNKEIALELGISVSTVENHINKALKLLRGSLPSHLYTLFIIVFFS